MNFARDIRKLFPELKIPDQLPVAVPWEDDPQHESSNRTALNSRGWLTGPLGLQERGPLDLIAGAFGLMHAQQIDSVGLVKVKMRDVMLSAQRFQQGLGSLIESV